MLRSIKVTEKVYKKIRCFQSPRETYSEVIARAFDAWATMDAIRSGEWPPKPDREKPK